MSRQSVPAGVHQGRPPLHYGVILGISWLVLVGCTLGRASSLGEPEGPIGSTALPAASPTALQISTPRPAPTLGPCVNDAQFIADNTIPDGTVVAPNAALDKSWHVQNSGTCDWGTGYSLVRISGPAMGAPDVSGLFPSRAGVEIDLRLALTAPSGPGTHTTVWQMRDPAGEFFGDSLFIVIVVGGEDA